MAGALPTPPGYISREVQLQLSNVGFHSGTQADRLVSTWAWLSLRRKSEGCDGHTMTLKVLPGHSQMPFTFHCPRKVTSSKLTSRAHE